MSRVVLVLPKYTRSGASSRLRTYQYLPFLEEKNWQFTVKPLFDEAYLDSLYKGKRRSRVSMVFAYLRRFFVILRASRYRFIWFEKELFPYMPAWIELLLALFGLKYVVDYDDAIFHNYDLSRNKWIRRFIGNKIDIVMRNAYCVIAGNEYLAERARTAGAKRVVVIPTVVDHHRYFFYKQPQETITIGWIGSPTTQKYVEDLLPVLQELGQESDFRLLLVGATADIVSRLPGIDVDVKPWSEGTETNLIQTMDIGIMPLQDGPWERGKCGYKLIQYMASGVPVIASPVGVNPSIVYGSGCGLLAADFSQWKKSFSRLINDPPQRKLFGEAGRRAVQERFSLVSQIDVLESCLISLEVDVE